MSLSTATPTRQRWLTPTLIVLAVIAAIVLGGILPIVAAGNELVFLAAGVLAIVFIVVVFAIPVHWLPAIALMAFCLIPLRVIPSTGAFNAFPPLSALLVIWVFRRVILRQNPNRGFEVAGFMKSFLPRLTMYCAVGVFTLWLVFSTVRSTVPQTSNGWSISFVVGVLIVFLVSDARAEARLLRSAWLWLGAIFSLYAILEQLLRSSPVNSAVYKALGADTIAPWSVYRSEASFGHPLNAGAFFAIPAALGLGAWLTGSRNRDLVFGLISAIGVVTTVSRGSILAVGIAFVFAVVMAVFVTGGARKYQRLTIIAVVGVIALIGLQNFQPLTDRQGSVESGLSADARTVGTGVALQAAQTFGWLGSGPGTSGISGRLFDTVVIENSIFQLLISVGIPGLFLFLSVMGMGVVLALRNRDIGSAAAIVAYIVSIAGYNSIDAVRSMHMIIGLLMILALSGEKVVLRSDASALRTGDFVDAKQVNWRRPPQAPLARPTVRVGTDRELEPADTLAGVR